MAKLGKLLVPIATGTLAALLAASPSFAQLSADQQKCQRRVGKEGRKLFQKTFKALKKCEDQISKGGLPVGTDCMLDAKAVAKIGKAEAKLTSKVGADCSDSTVAGLTFAGDCAGVVTASSLVSCLILSHEDAAQQLIDLVYARNGQLGADERKCQKMLATKGVKIAAKRLGEVQKCKKDIARGKLAAGTNCISETVAGSKLDGLFRKSVDSAGAKCAGAPVNFSSKLDLAAPCGGVGEPRGAASCVLCEGSRMADVLTAVEFGTGPIGQETGSASAVQITNTADCVGGPLSRCRVDDYLLANNRIRVVVQDVQRNLFGVGQFGGQIIDADLVRGSGDPDRDNFEEWATSLNIENTAHYTTLTVLNDGSDGNAAVVRAVGVDDLLDFINASSVVAGFGLTFPSSADDVDLTVTVTTDYILEPGVNYVRVETTVTNTGGSDQSMFFGEYLDGSGQVELFQPAYGFGEPLVAMPCPTDAANPCNFLAYSGQDGADGVSYGYVHTVPGSSTFTSAGVTVPQLETNILAALLGLAPPPYTVAAAGEPDDSLTFTRYFVVGDGTVSSISDARNEIACIGTGTLNGTVAQNAGPVDGADITVLGDLAQAPAGVAKNVITHTRTNAFGQYSLTLPPGDYTVVANMDGSPFEGGGSAPVEHAVTIALLQTTTQNVTLPNTGALRVRVGDSAAWSSAPLAAKASVVGFDPSPDPGNSQDVLVTTVSTGVFGDQIEDGMPFGVAQSLFIDDSGDSGVVSLEPGSYRVVVSHGPEYSTFETDITVTAGSTQTVDAILYPVVDTTGFVSTDNHVHSIDSPDSEVTKAERVISMLAEGVDYFSSTDHDFLSDFSSTISDLGVGSLITTATGEEITTFDYGHFNSWPVSIDATKVNGGGVDHGAAAPAGLDYPSQGNYSLAPVDIIAAAHANAAPDWLSNTVQINHIASYFGVDGGLGLAVDTAVTPPTSGVPAAGRRLDPAVSNFFTDTFDALEVWIGDDRSHIYDNFLGRNIGDWFNLLNQGIVRTGVSDSDTHRRTLTQAGIPRTMVASPTDDAGAIDPQNVSDNVNAGRAIGTNAPMVRVTAVATSPGGAVAALGIGRCYNSATPAACTNTTTCPPCQSNADCTSPATCNTPPLTICTDNGVVDFTVDIQSPTWAEFDTVEFYYNTTTTRTTTTGVQTGAGAIDVNSYTVSPDVTHTAGSDFTVSTVSVGGASRLEARTVLSFGGGGGNPAALAADTWVVALVKGTDGVSKPLFPVAPNDLKVSTNFNLAALTDGNLNEDGITALAFTNPVFIDFGCDGWTAPGVQVVP